jgi:hypothetical protein
MPTDEMQILNARINRCWRILMWAWMKRWRVIRRDPLEQPQATLCVREAIKCRDRSKVR